VSFHPSKCRRESRRGRRHRDIKSTASISLTPILISLLKSGKDLASLAKEDVLKSSSLARLARSLPDLRRLIRIGVREMLAVDLMFLLSTSRAGLIGESSRAVRRYRLTKLRLSSSRSSEAPGQHWRCNCDGLLEARVQGTASSARDGRLFLEVFQPDGVVIIDSTSLNLTPAKTSGIDNTQIYLNEGKNVLAGVRFRLVESMITTPSGFRPFLNGRKESTLRLQSWKTSRKSLPSLAELAVP
jgi:tyrosinase